VHGLGRLEFDAQSRPVKMLGTIQDITERKQAEAAIIESRAKLEAALASMTDAVFISDTAGRLLEFNEAYARFHKFKNKAECGTTIEENRKFVELLEPGGEPAPIETRPALRALRGESGTDLEYTLRRKDTGETWIGSYSYAPIRDKDGAITGAVAIARDVTEKKRAETALRESEESLREAQRIAGLGAHVQDLSTGAWSASDVLRGILGAGPDDDLSFPKLSALVHPEDRAAFGACFTEDALRKGQRFELEHRIIRKSDQNVRWVRAVGNIENDSHGNPVKVRGTVQDITERKLEQAALRESKDLLQLFIEQAPVALAMFDREMRYLAVSRHWLRQYDLVGQEIVGRSHYEINPDLPEHFKEAHRRGLAGETVKSDEDRYNQADGKERWVRWQIVPWRAGDGSVGGILIFAEDITERKRSQAALRDSKQLLELFIKHSPAALVMLDREMRHVAASLRWLEAFSLKEEEIIGRSHYEVVPYVPEHWKEAHRRGMAGEVVRVDAELFKGPDGTLVWTRYEVMPWRTGNGDVGGIIIFGEDITERKAAQEALEKAEQKFREIFEAAPEGIFQTTPTGKLLAVNPAGANMLGYSTWEHPDSVVRDLARDIWLDHRERARFMEHLERHGEIEGFSCQVKCKDGSAIWVSISARKICG
jgi:PAS domain S-box-containing protein